MKKVLFYPDPPVQLPGHSLSKTITYFTLIGYELTNDINDDWDIGVHWDIKDINETPPGLLKDERLVLNCNINDVTKSNVERIFSETFGYSSLADTTKFGYCVRKGERQSAHDGKLVRIPCEKEKGYLYQLLIDNRMTLDMVYDIRIPIFLGKIPELFIKSKTIEGVFEDNLSKGKIYWMGKTEEYLSKEEIDNITSFSEKIGMDIGEIDALRDNSTGKLYLVDVNNIPGADVFKYIKDADNVKLSLAFFLDEELSSITDTKT